MINKINKINKIKTHVDIIMSSSGNEGVGVY
jgi:cysteine synthase